MSVIMKTLYQRSARCLKNDAVCFFLLLMLLLISKAQATNTDEFAIEIEELEHNGTGTLFLQADQLSTRAIAVQSSVKLDIAGVQVKATMKQSFRNESSDWVEGWYVFPLPDNAAITSLDIHLGDRTITGRVKEREQARQAFQSAQDQGRVVALVEQHRPNLFSIRISHIAPASTIDVQLGYTQTVDHADNAFDIQLPTTLTPRYNNTTVADANAISPVQVPVSDQWHPAVSINVAIHGSTNLDISSPSGHDIVTETTTTSTYVTLATPSLMDRDFKLRWQSPEPQQPGLQSWFEKDSHGDWLLTLITPPGDDVLAQQPLAARELMLVIDTSGSMAGQSIRAARAALLSALDGLTEIDTFNIIEFNDQVRALFTTPVSASADHVATARQFVRRLEAGGGTEMMPAIKLALEQTQETLTLPRAEPATPDNNVQMLRQVVFITDGAVGNEDALLHLIRTRLGNRRWFGVGIGTAPNSYFMRQSARAGRGSYTDIRGVEQAEQRMRALFARMSAPVLTDLSIQWQGEPGESALSPLPDLYADETLALPARLSRETRGFSIQGNYRGQPWRSSMQVSDAQEVHTGLGQIWARTRIESLLEDQRYSGIADLHKSDILNLALAHSLSSPYTSFIAEDTLPTRPANAVTKTHAVPNLLPAGNNWSTQPLPSTNANTDTLLWTGFILSCLSLVLLRVAFVETTSRENEARSQACLA